MTIENCYERLVRICERALHRPLDMEEKGNAAMAAESLIRLNRTYRLDEYEKWADHEPSRLFADLLWWIKDSWENTASKQRVMNDTEKKLVQMLFDCKIINDELKNFILVRNFRDFPVFFKELCWKGSA